MLKYERGLNHSYLIFSEEDSCIDDLTVSMLRENSISGLLPVKITKSNGKTEVAFEISMYQSMQKAFENQRINSKQIMNCLQTLNKLLEELEGYYLDSKGLVLDPENIYWSMDLENIYFCYNPERTANNEGLEVLGQLILQRADFGDYKSVVYAYELYQAAKEDNFSLQKLLENLEEVSHNSYCLTKQEVPIVADNSMDSVAYSMPQQGLETSADNHLAERVPEDELITASQNTEEVMQSMSMIFEDDEDDWEKEEPTGKLFGRSKKKKVKKERKKNERKTDDTTDFMEESFFSGGGMTETDQIDVYSNRYLVINSANESTYNFKINNFPFLIGSLPYAVDGCIENSCISRFHARFDQNRGKIYLSDLNSASGTFLNNERLKGSVQKEIKLGDRIKFGDLDFAVTECV